MSSVVGNSPSGLDVDWLLHKNDTSYSSSQNAKGDERNDTQSPPPAPLTVKSTEPTPPQSPIEPSEQRGRKNPDLHVAPTEPAAPPPPAKPAPTKQTNGTVTTPPIKQGSSRTPSADDSKGHKSLTSSLKKESNERRRPSWISSLSSKFGSANSTPTRGGSVDHQKPPATPSPQPSPKVAFGNPFDKKENNPQAKEEPKVMVPQHTSRRPSVLVAAGKETKLDQPSFLSSALRRLSSSNNATMGKGGASGAICPRRVMNVDRNRERVRVPELDQNKLKRVAFCVDVEIAGRAAQADEEDSPGSAKLPVSNKQVAQNAASDKKETKDAKYKDMGEGAALKNPSAATIEKEKPGGSETDGKSVPPAPSSDVKRSNSNESQKGSDPPNDSLSPDTQPGMTRKKEKKKRSEAERKERRERKRKHAEANGLVPLELIKDDDSDSNASTPGVATPLTGASPTTDPLRIYKRCCQLRETTVMSRIKEQISKPAATLAEAPGTVAVIDLSGMQMQLQDVQTFGDWLAIVPVRKLVLDNCGLNDEALRIILSGMAGCKSPEQARINRKLSRVTGKAGREQLGIIEKLSLKHNSEITVIGWKYIALFLHISKSLKAIDLSGIPFPKGNGDLSRSSTLSSGADAGPNGTPSKRPDYCALISRAIAERLGDKLEELILSDCGLSSTAVGEIIDAVLKCKIRRLGLAGNGLDQEAMQHTVRYIVSGICEGLDLGGNNLHGHLPLLSDALDHDNPLFAVSFAGCGLDSKDLEIILNACARLKNLKFIDLSNNHALFTEKNNAVPIFRKMLPRLTALKRIHLANVGLIPDHVIALSEILPDCPSLCHISVLDNQALQHAMNSKEGSSQEEACAFFASLMTAVRVSQTIVAIEVEVPSSESSEVVKALASQVVAYSLRNMERSALDEIGGKTGTLPNKDAPEVLLHLVGHMEGIEGNHDSDDPAPDEDYVIASTGIVKALGVCLGTGDGTSRSQSRNITPSASGTSTPLQIPQRPGTPKKPRNVTLELCESARKIRMRLRPALVKEDKAGNDEKFRRLFFLDQTLQRIIQRFEDEYPETKVPEVSSSINGHTAEPASYQLADDSVISASINSNALEQIASTEEYMGADEKADRDDRFHLARSNSNTSLAAKAYTNEEGRMHRFGQDIRREIIRQHEIEGELSSDEEVDAQHLAEVRQRFDDFKGEEIKSRVREEGPDSVLKSLGLNAKELLLLQKEDPDGFAVFRDSQIAAQINSGRRKSES